MVMGLGWSKKSCLIELAHMVKRFKMKDSPVFFLAQIRLMIGCLFDLQ